MASWRWCDVLWLLLVLSSACRAQEGSLASFSGLYSASITASHVPSTTVSLVVASSPTPSPSSSHSPTPSPFSSHSPSPSPSPPPSPSPSPSPPPFSSLSSLLSPSHSLTPSPSHSYSSSFSSSRPPSPSPTPSPFLDFNKQQCLYLHIGHMNITYATNVTVTGEKLLKGWSHQTVANCSLTSSFINYTRVFGASATKPQFSISFLFSTDADSQDQEWYVSEFLHYNYTSNNTFHYRGLKTAIIAPAGMSYKCDNVTAAGSNADNHVSHVSFTDVTAQAFMTGPTHTPTYVNCGQTSSNNFVIDLVIGLLVGGTILIAILVIVVTVLVKKFKRREYDLLED